MPPTPGFVRDIRECAVSVVVIENVLAVLRHIQIREAVVVVIAPYAAESVSIAGHAGFFRDVSESAVSVITVECIARVNAALVEIAGGAQTVVEWGAARTEDDDDVGRAAVVGEAEEGDLGEREDDRGRVAPALCRSRAARLPVPSA